jgi:hypothetical protein
VYCIFFRDPFKNNDFESGIEQLEHIRSRILEKEMISPDPASVPYINKPIPMEKTPCSLETADQQLFRSVMATRGDITELLLAESSDRCWEETDCR